MAFETFGYYRNALLEEMDKRNIKQMLNTKVLEFSEEGILVEQDGKTSLIKADTCVYSMGMKCNDDIVKEIKDIIGDIKTYIVGDCERIGKVGDALHAGYEAAISII